MADVDINKFTTQILREGATPSSPGFVVSEGQDPVNPPGTNNFVPYSGATSNVELGEFGLETGFINLDTTPTGTPTTQGTIFWDADDETVDIILNGYTMKIGEDLFYPVKNQTGSTIAKGVAVRFAGTLGASGRLLIEPFIANGTVPSSLFMGVTAEEILNGDDGKVLYFGRVRGINTDAFNEGDILYASTTVAGGYQTAIPLPPNNIVQVAAVISKSPTVGTIFVRPTLGSNINTDEGVKITSVADKNLLQYQSGTSLWENKTLAQVLGGTSSQFVKGDGSLDSTSYQPLLTNPVTGTGTTNYLPKFTGSTTIGNSTTQTDATGNLMVGSANAGNAGTINVSVGVAGATAGGIQLWAATNQTHYIQFGDGTTGAQVYAGYLGYAHSTDSLLFGTNGADKMFLNSSGNLGLGVTPSAWGSINRVFETTAGTIMLGRSDLSAWGRNFYYNSADAGIYTGNGHATGYFQSSGQHFWVTAPSGMAGNPISFTQPMTLTSGGNLLVGTTSDNGARLQVSGGLNVLSTYASDSAAQSVLRDNTGVALNFGGTASGFKWLQAQDSTGASTYYNLLLNPYGGNVGIGTASPEALLHVNAASTGGEGGYIYIDNPATSTLNNSVGIRFVTSSGGSFAGVYTGNIANIVTNASDGASALTFGTWNGSTAAERMRITSDGYLRLSTSSGGIQFNGDTAAANALDDYEEGNWTPSVGGNATYNAANKGIYTKIGNVVTCQFRLHITTLGTGSAFQLSGLPFSSANITDVQSGHCSYYQDLAVNTIYLAFYIENNATTAQFVGKSTSGATVDNGIALFKSGTIIYGQITYRTS